MRKQLFIRTGRMLLLGAALFLPYQGFAVNDRISLAEKKKIQLRLAQKATEQKKQSGFIDRVQKYIPDAIKELPLFNAVGKKNLEKESNEPGLNPAQMMAQLLQSLQSASNGKSDFIHQVLGTLPCVHNAPLIISPREKQELQGSWLIEDIAHETRTSFGAWGLHQVMQPVDDLQTIKKRQNIIRALTDETLRNRITPLLKTIGKNEDALFSYWQNDDLSKSVQTFYYRIPLVKKFLNKNPVALEAATWLDMGRASMNVVYALGINGLVDEFALWWFGGEGRDLDIVRGIKNGLSGPIRDLDFRRSAISKDPPPVTMNLETGELERRRNFAYWQKCVFQGTLGDRFDAMFKGYDGKWPFFGYTYEKKSNMQNGPWNARKVLDAGVATTGALALSGWRYYGLVENLRSVFNRWQLIFAATKQLHNRLVHVADMMETMRALHTTLKKHEVFASSCIVEHFDQVFKPTSDASRKLKELTTLLGKSSFKDASSFFYSRGYLLRAHSLLTELKKELIPALQAVGELDAYNALAHKCMQKEHPWTFVEFIDSAKPEFILEDYRVPMYGSTSVPNSITLGAQGQPTKILITGPNGGGKSVVIKLIIGQCLATSHSVGVVPARSCRTTLFNGLRTCLNPKEQMRKGMSTFMAASAGMDALTNYIKETQADKKYMILVDEPYRGTVNDETAARTGTFCRDVMYRPNIITVLATHIMPDLTMQEECAWGAYSIAIEEPTPGVFKRKYELKREVPGERIWWFTNKAMRSRYVDWIKTQYAPEAEHAVADEKE